MISITYIYYLGVKRNQQLSFLSRGNGIDMEKLQFIGQIKQINPTLFKKFRFINLPSFKLKNTCYNIRYIVNNLQLGFSLE